MRPRSSIWLSPRDDIASAFEDVAAARPLDGAARVREAASLSRTATAFLDRFPMAEQRRLLRAQEPLDPEREAIWRALVRRGRGG